MKARFLFRALKARYPDQRAESGAVLSSLRPGDIAVDVGAHELQVFRGGARVLSQDRPVILFECERRHLRSHTMQDVFGFLERLGYQGKFFSPMGLLPLKDFDSAIHQKNEADRFWDAYGY